MMKDNFWVEESNSQPTFCKIRKRRVGKRKLEFVGWGSRPIIEFLEAIGQDSSKKHSQQEVASLIRKYINDKGLASAEKKKKKVICDEWLYLLFGKKSMLRTKVYDMLEEHFAENHDDPDDDELSDSADEDYGEKKSFELRNFPLGQTKAIKTPKSCFAAIIPENIKLIYLKRSVIQELVKFPESFEYKVVGSFVRLKSDPDDIFQKNRFQLLQVTGVHEVAVSDGADIEIYLRLSNFLKDASISMLSDDNFTEEEVQDVCDRMKAGSLNRLTINELQLKAQVLHVYITNNWIAKEINLLQKLAEHANEKGWQREKFEYLERRKMLQNPSEREKLLLKVPDVVAEELEPESMLTAASEKADISASSPKSILRGSSDVSGTDASGSGEIGSPPKVTSSDLHALRVLDGGVDGVIQIFPEDPKGSGEIGSPPKVISSDLHALQVLDGGIDGVIHILPKDPKGSGELGSPAKVISSDSHALQVQDGSINGVIHIPPKVPKVRTEELDALQLLRIQTVNTAIASFGEKDKIDVQIKLLTPSSPILILKRPAVLDLLNTGTFTACDPSADTPNQETMVANVSWGEGSREGSGEKYPHQLQPSTTVVIELSDDDDDDEMETVGRNCSENPNEAVWHYLDPRGQTQGPFQLSLLKQWSDAKYFHPGFTVWKTGQTSSDGILLLDVLHRTFQ